MQGIQTSKSAFNTVKSAANLNEKARIKITHKQHILAAYGIGSANNNWTDYKAFFEDDYFSLETFRKDSKPHRMIAVFKYPVRDNDGYKFSVYTFAQKAFFQTNELRHALGNFKSPEPQLKLVP